MPRQSGRLLTFCAQLAQAFGMIALSLSLAHLLGAADVVRFSLTVATAQFLAVLAFEWLRLAALRHYPGPQEERPARLAQLRGLALAVTAFTGIGLGLVAATAGDSLATTGLVVAALLALTLLQGITDLHLMIVRLDGGLVVAAYLQILRSAAMCLGALAGAWLWAGAEAALAGLTMGYVISFGATIALRRERRYAPYLRWSTGFLRLIASYGLPAAAASQAHSSLTWLIRLAAVAALGPTTPAAAGFSIALDVLSRPFGFVGTFLTTLNMPRLVAQFEARAESTAAATTFRGQLRHHYGLMLGLPAITALALWVALPDLAAWLLPAPQLSGFLDAVPALVLWFLLLFTLQATLAVEPQLHGRTGITLVLALCHLGGGAVILAAALLLGQLDPPQGTTALPHLLALLNAFTALLILIRGIGLINAAPLTAQIWPPSLAALLLVASLALPDTLRTLVVAAIAGLYALYALKDPPQQPRSQ